MAGLHESIRKGFETGGALALLGDLYTDDGTIHATTWSESLAYTDPTNGDTAWYYSLPFIVSEESIIRDFKETTIYKIFMGIAHHKSTGDAANFTDSQIDHFTQHMADMDEYLERHDIRGSLAILRLINPLNPLADIWLAPPCIVDRYSVEESGIILELTEANDILSSPAYPVGTMCSFRFGDSRSCGVDANSAANLYQGMVESGSTASLIIDSSLTNNTADNYWRPGILKATSGPNEGEAREVAFHDTSENSIRVTIPFSNAFQLGDTFDLRRVCRKTFEFCRDVFSNAPRFGGYPYVNNDIQGLFYRGK